MNATGIEYLDFTWSPLVGCSGNGCAVVNNCWAKYMKKRNLNGCPECTAFKPHSHLERLKQPFNTKKPSIIGACYSADMWDNGFSNKDRKRVIEEAQKSPWHYFINLTKQTQNIPKTQQFPDNWIQGTSICTENDLYRIKDLWGCRAKHLALSIEPLYERLTDLDLLDFEWVIIGCQTKPTKLPKKEWVDEIINLARDTKVPIYIKNNLDSLGYNLHEYPNFLKIGKRANIN